MVFWFPCQLLREVPSLGPSTIESCVCHIVNFNLIFHMYLFLVKNINTNNKM
jgi:hypothetical protein